MFICSTFAKYLLWKNVGKEEDVHKVRPTQPDEWAKRTQSNIFWRLRPELPEHPHFLISFLLKVSFWIFGMILKWDVRAWKNHRKGPKMSYLQDSRMTTVLITFFRKHCVISREFVLEGQIWNIEFWPYVLGILLKHILQGCQFYLHNNYTVHFGIYLVLNACQLYLECED